MLKEIIHLHVAMWFGLCQEQNLNSYVKIFLWSEGDYVLIY